MDYGCSSTPSSVWRLADLWVIVERGENWLQAVGTDLLAPHLVPGGALHLGRLLPSGVRLGRPDHGRDLDSATNAADSGNRLLSCPEAGWDGPRGR